jgi:hypothetical protein
MRPSSAPGRALRVVLALAALAAPAALGAAVGCQPPDILWICLNPKTGKDDDSVGDFGHLGPDGQPDPCHCYDACGPSPECPIVVDAGPPPLGCDAGDGG